MDLYPSQSDLDHGTNQLHDFNPGFGPSVGTNGDRVFWTTVLPEGSVNVNPGAGRAELSVTDLPIRDFTRIPNSLSMGPSVPATVSLDLVWTGDVTRRVNVNDAAHGFAGNYAETQATISWSASEAGFTFTSNPASTSTSLFAEVGHERNGIFFPAAPGGPNAGAAEPQASGTAGDAATSPAAASGLPPPGGSLDSSLSVALGAAADARWSPPAQGGNSSAPGGSTAGTNGAASLSGATAAPGSSAGGTQAESAWTLPGVARTAGETSAIDSVFADVWANGLALAP